MFAITEVFKQEIQQAWGDPDRVTEIAMDEFLRANAGDQNLATKNAAALIRDIAEDTHALLPQDFFDKLSEQQIN